MSRTETLELCELCGYPVVVVRGVRGRTRERHDVCTKVNDAMTRLETLVFEGMEHGELVFAATPEGCAAARRFRSRLWTLANYLNDSPSNGGAGQKDKRRHLYAPRWDGRAACGARPGRARRSETARLSEVTCEKCIALACDGLGIGHVKVR